MSKFKVWVDDNKISTTGDTQNMFDATTFNGNDGQRNSGFVSGTTISSIYMNSVLRQSALVTAALMDLVNDSNLDLTSSTSSVSTAISTYLTGLTVANSTNVTTNINGNAITDIFENNGTTAKNATNATNATKANKIKLFTTAPTSADIEEGYLIIYVGSTVPQIRLSGVLYLITST